MSQDIYHIKTGDCNILFHLEERIDYFFQGEILCPFPGFGFDYFSESPFMTNNYRQVVLRNFVLTLVRHLYLLNDQFEQIRKNEHELRRRLRESESLSKEQELALAMDVYARLENKTSRFTEAYGSKTVHSNIIKAFATHFIPEKSTFRCAEDCVHHALQECTEKTIIQLIKTR